MGYTTYFSGSFKLNKPLDDETFKLLKGLNETRRMKRNTAVLADLEGLTKKETIEKYGEDCGLWIGGDRYSIEGADVIDPNTPPEGQPSLWCNWMPDPTNKDEIYWDDGEKFYHYVEWIEYINDRILKPRGYKLTNESEVFWSGEDDTDLGIISVEDGEIVEKPAMIFYLKSEDAVRVSKIVNQYLESEYKEIVDYKLDEEGSH